jgi:hypothetical protein
MSLNVFRIFSRRTGHSDQGAVGIVILMMSLVFVPIIIAHVALTFLQPASAPEIAHGGAAANQSHETTTESPSAAIRL